MLDVPAVSADTVPFSKIDFSGCRAVVAAVSGGGDSLALLFLLKEYLSSHETGVELLAVTVDHGIRPDAAAEADAVAALCAKAGIRHRTMRWTAATPISGLQQAAREARYCLLAAAAEEAGADLILTGHTLDDQLETVAMRKKRGDGRGLAGIAPATLYDGRLWIVRPLLGIRREQLRGYLRRKGVKWHEDPSNRDPKYERVRVRAMLAGADGEAQAHAKLVTEMQGAAAVRIGLGERAALLVRRHARRVSPGLYRLDRDFVAAPDGDAAVYALRILLAVVGGRAQLPDAARSAALFAQLSVPDARATLSRSVIEARADGFYLRRERRGLPAAGAMAAGATWDERHRIEAGTGEGTEIAPFGRDAAGAGACPDHDGCPAALRRAALAVEPALWRGDACLGHAPTVPLAAPWARFLPSFDLAAAAAAVELVGGRPIPTLPLSTARAAGEGRGLALT